MLRWSTVPGEQLDDELIEQMWSLRAAQVGLRVDPASDRASFARRVRMAQRNLLFRDPGGELGGIFSSYWTESPGGDAVWLLPEYGYLGAAHRGDPGFMLGLLQEVLRLQGVARGRPLWFCGVGYPRSFQTLARIAPVWCLRDPDAPAQAVEVLEYLRDAFYGEAWDPVTHHVQLPTIPEPRRPGPPPSPTWAWYEEHLPHWEQGVGLAIACRLRRRMALTALKDAVQRARRR